MVKVMDMDDVRHSVSTGLYETYLNSLQGGWKQYKFKRLQRALQAFQDSEN